MKNMTFKTQFIVSIVLVLVLSVAFTIAGALLDIWLTDKEVILPANYYSSMVSDIEDYINKNKDRIMDRSFKSELDKAIPAAGFEYEIINANGKLSYGRFKTPIVSKISMVNKETTDVLGRFDPKVIKYIPLKDGSTVKGMVILKYYIRVSTKNPDFNWVAVYLDVYLTIAPFIYIILFSVIFGRVFSRRLNVPLKQLMEASEKIKARDLNFNITYESDNELGKLCSSFEDMRSDLKKSLEKQWETEEERQEMVSAVAHDLRTPITIIKGHVEGLLESRHIDEEKLYKYLNLIDKNTDRMSNLVGKINLLTKIEKADFKLKNVPCDIALYMNEKKQEYDILVKDKNIKFESEIEDSRDLRSLINIDTCVLSEILDNLVANSIRFTPEKGSIKLNCKINKDMLTFSVSDTGCGFSSKDIKNAFKRFYQGDESRSKEKGHSGLGLYIVKSLTDKLNGSVEIKNNSLCGSEVKVCIPI